MLYGEVMSVCLFWDPYNNIKVLLVCEKDVELQNAEHGGLCGNLLTYLLHGAESFLRS